jgi:hypothetical protein
VFTYYDAQGVARRIADRYVTTYLRLAATVVGVSIPVTVGALRATGATALLQGKVPLEMIKLVGRWRSDKVFRYLHTQSEILMSPLTTTMLEHAS